MAHNLPIGVFDSGVGGLTVLREMVHALPGERFVYFGDTQRAPYGGKTPETIITYAREITRYLNAWPVKAVVTACNTESAYALEDMRKVTRSPVLGVLEPAVRRTLAVTRTGRVGLMATKATVESGAYQAMLRRHRPDIAVVTSACTKLVPLIEAGETTGSALEAVLRMYLEPLMSADIDTLILGCTHYPLVADRIRAIVGPAVTLVDPARHTATALRRLLETHNLTATVPQGDHVFLASKKTPAMQRLIRSVKADAKLELVDIEALHWQK
ncbi:MAG: glutamate racemase [Eubacteriales bacterium]|nr:glutamate racemase [Eubacteriales bacterium]